MSNLYIGLGGAGIDAAVAIYEKRLSEKTDTYLLIDTDIASERHLPDALRNDFVDIGSKSPNQIKTQVLSSPMKRWFLGWYDYYDSDRPLHDGSGTIRQYGRIGLLGKYDEVYRRLSDALHRMYPNEVSYIIFITGSCGGTGSAIAMDVSYMINTILKSGVIPNAENHFQTCLLIALPELWIQFAQPDFQYRFISNVVAFYKEIQFLMDNKDVVPSPFYPVVPPKDWMEGVPFVPFSTGYAIESRGKHKEQLAREMADFICSFGGVNQNIPVGIHDLAGRFLAERLEQEAYPSNGGYSCIDWKFSRKMMDSDKEGCLTTEEIWDRKCRQY